MNMPPDEALLALWLEDELVGDEFAAVEAWAKTQPDQLAMREQARKWKAMVKSAIPASEEPPYADFFNARIARSIAQSQPKHESRQASEKFIFPWRRLALPLAACAGMAFTFWLGIHSRKIPVVESIAEMTAPTAMDSIADANADLPAVVYTPQEGVRAECFDSDTASATVIILDGLAAIPDTTDLTRQTASSGAAREIDSTAQAAPPASKATNP